jgi:V/A-type H+-transporting ATPase subunit I
MQRVAIVAPVPRLAPVLERVGGAGVVELDLPAEPHEVAADTLDRRAAELARVGGSALRAGPTDAEVAALAGWVPDVDLPALTEDLGELGAAVVPVRRPAGVEPPSLLPENRAGRSFDLLVQTYATVPYADLDPSLIAGLAYVTMFGMMFGDAGHGLLLLAGALLVRAGRLPGRWRHAQGLRRAWPFLAGGGVASIVFGALYGEAFGPTGLLPVIWLDPLTEPVPMLLAAVGVGAVLLAGAYALGTANRVREGGWAHALYARTGVAGSLLFVALGLLAAGLWLGPSWLVVISALVATAGLVLSFVGLLAAGGGGGAGVVQAVVELVDLVIRLGSNLVSFARLAAFGLTHAALGALVWQGTTALWQPDARAVAAVLVFVLGNALTFALEALVAGIQALRLEYYELFSRVFVGQGRPFRPWHLPEPGLAADETGGTR